MGPVLKLLLVCVAVVISSGVTLGEPGPQAATAPSGSPAAPKEQPPRGPVWTQFEMNRQDADGNYLWTTLQNWNRGLPGANLSVEIGDDHSGKALHCVIPPGCDAVCGNFELAEHGRTQGTTLRIGRGASLTIRESGVLSKDRESTVYLDGTLSCLKAGGGLRVGGPWGRPDIEEPSCCHLLIGPTGLLDAWFVGINTTHRAESAPSSPWGPKFFGRATDSEIVVDGGWLSAREGLRISTAEAARPGALRLAGSATFTSRRRSEFGVDVWGGVWEIDGPEVTIRVGDVEFWGNKFAGAVNTKTNQRVGPGRAVLKLTGDGVSTIYARDLNFIDAALLDVSALEVPPGTYRVIDGASVGETNLSFAEGTDTDRWRFRFDRDRGDLLLTFED